MWAQLHVLTQLRQPLHAWTLPQLTGLFLSPQWPWDVNEDPKKHPLFSSPGPIRAGFEALRCRCRCATLRADIHPSIPPSLHPSIHRYSSSQRSPLSILLDIIQYIQQHMRHRSLVHTAKERVNTPPFEDDLLPLQQDISSFEYLQGGGGG